ncbi:MAG: hypothetical protein N3F63_01385 [Thermoplasmata archaeon]|nr:hypothetical protein [Thermoplasmata archaeon]
MKKSKRRFSSVLAYTGGFLLIIAGYSAHNELIEGLLGYLLNLGVGTPFVSILLYILVLLGALGGITVILGGYAAARNHVKVGCFLISTGSGFGILELLVFLAVKYNMNLWKGFEVFVGSLFGIGIVLSIVSRAVLGDYM